jgi:hypothetical protein
MANRWGGRGPRHVFSDTFRIGGAALAAIARWRTPIKIG